MFKAQKQFMGLNTATFTINGSLQDFTDQERIEKSFHLNPSAKDLIESCGVPQAEVFGLLVNGEAKPFSYNVRDGDRLTVIPKEEIYKSKSKDNIRLVDELPVRFVADVHLGKLTHHLRLLGFDTLYSNSMEDSEIVDTASREKRAALTRDVGLLKYGKLNYGYWLRSEDPDKQLIEVIQYFNLSDKLNPFVRCISCNGTLQSVSKTEIEPELPPRVKESFDHFKQCESCGKVYWRGSHYNKLLKKVRAIQQAL